MKREIESFRQAFQVFVMSVPLDLLRNIRFPARPDLCPFDDLTVAILADFFADNRDLYDVEKEGVCEGLYTNVVKKLAEQCSYSDSREELGFPTPEYELQDVRDLLAHFETCEDDQLRSFYQLHQRQARNRALKLPSAWKSSVCKTDIVVVRPCISVCMYCDNQPLTTAIKHQSSWGSAQGGHSWCYSLNEGAGIAAVCESTCKKCGTLYRLQTYTPGDQILQKIGVVSVPNVPVSETSFGDY